MDVSSVDDHKRSLELWFIKVSKEMDRKNLVYGILLFRIFSGFLVNPIRSGVDAVEKVPVLQEISKIHESDEQALWIVEGMELPF